MASRFEDERWAWIERDGDVLPPEDDVEVLPLDCDFDAEEQPEAGPALVIPPGYVLEPVGGAVRLVRYLPDIAEYGKRTA